MAARLSDKALVRKLLAEVRGLRQRVEEQDELIVAQRQRVAEQDELIAAQQRRIADLESDLAKARKNSSTSSKPPSSDIVTAPGDPKTSKKQGKRTKGAQPGHPKHEREPFAPEAVDETHDHRLEFCPDCGTGLLEAAQPPRVVQQVEIVRVPIRIDEHRGHPAFCPNCQKIHYAPLPAQVEHGQLAGPRLTALVAYLKGMCHASFSTIRKFPRDVVGVTLSRGYLRKLVEKVSDRLAGSYAELLRLLAAERTLNVDETGHKENGERFWTWCFRAQLFTLFKNTRPEVVSAITWTTPSHSTPSAAFRPHPDRAGAIRSLPRGESSRSTTPRRFLHADTAVLSRWTTDPEPGPLCDQAKSREGEILRGRKTAQAVLAKHTVGPEGEEHVAAAADELPDRFALLADEGLPSEDLEHAPRAALAGDRRAEARTSARSSSPSHRGSARAGLEGRGSRAG